MAFLSHNLWDCMLFAILPAVECHIPSTMGFYIHNMAYVIKVVLSSEAIVAFLVERNICKYYKLKYNTSNGLCLCAVHCRSLQGGWWTGRGWGQQSTQGPHHCISLQRVLGQAYCSHVQVRGEETGWMREKQLTLCPMQSTAAAIPSLSVASNLTQRRCRSPTPTYTVHQLSHSFIFLFSFPPFL